MFDITMKTPGEIGALIARAAALLLAAFAAFGLVVWDAGAGKVFAVVLLATFLAATAAPRTLGPKVGAVLLCVTTVVCLMAPEGPAGIQPNRFVLFALVLPFGLALHAPLLAHPVVGLVRALRE